MADKEKASLRHILKGVSRSFYLSLIILPPPVRDQICLAYLFCRLADTIADALPFSQDKKIWALQLFRKQFVVVSPVRDELRQLEQCCGQHAVGKEERALFLALPTLMDVFQQLPVLDQQCLRALVLKLTQGMEMDLVYFDRHARRPLHALPDLATLDLYTYYVAGVVGEFWTTMHCMHIRSMQYCDLEALCTVGIHFGQGLQLTNILKDLSKDIANGRCYVPQDHLDRVGLTVESVQGMLSLGSLRPIVMQLVQYTMQHLQHAHTYVQALPLRAIRVRLSCMWPLLFAIQTLNVIAQYSYGLRPQDRLKISRFAVYRTMFFSLPCALSHRLCSRYYQSLLKRLQMTVARVESYGSTLGVPSTRQRIGRISTPHRV